MSSGWIKYKCKSGEPLFIYNKETGEHRWLTSRGSLSSLVMVGEPVKLISTASTQTDDTGCYNGCTSMHVETHPSVLCRNVSVQRIKHENNNTNHSLADVVESVVADHCYPSNATQTSSHLRARFAVDSEISVKTSPRNNFTCNTAQIETDLNSCSEAMQTSFQPQSDLAVVDIKLESKEDFPQNIMVTTSPYSNKAAVKASHHAQPRFSVNSQQNDANNYAQNDLVNADNTRVDQPLATSDTRVKPILKQGLCALIAIEHNYAKRYPSNEMINGDNAEIYPNELPIHTEENMDIEGNMAANVVATVSTEQDIFENDLLQQNVESVQNEVDYTQSDLIGEQVLVNADKYGPVESNSVECGYLGESYAKDSKMNETADQAKLHVQVRDLLQENILASVSKKDFLQNTYTCTCNLLENNARVTKCEQGTQTTTTFIQDPSQTSEVKVQVKRESIKDGNQLHKCPHCGKDFKSKTKCIIHVRIHTKEKPFMCFVCNKRFARKDHLELHKRTHSGLRVHECVNCKMTFTAKSGLNRHRRRQACIQKTVQCLHCNEKLVNKVSLASHVKRKHPEHNPPNN